MDALLLRKESIKKNINDQIRDLLIQKRMQKNRLRRYLVKQRKEFKRKVLLLRRLRKCKSKLDKLILEVVPCNPISTEREQAGEYPASFENILDRGPLVNYGYSPMSPSYSSKNDEMTSPASPENSFDRGPSADYLLKVNGYSPTSPSYRANSENILDRGPLVNYGYSPTSPSYSSQNDETTSPENFDRGPSADYLLKVNGYSPTSPSYRANPDNILDRGPLANYGYSPTSPSYISQNDETTSPEIFDRGPSADYLLKVNRYSPTSPSYRARAPLANYGYSPMSPSYSSQNDETTSPATPENIFDRGLLADYLLEVNKYSVVSTSCIPASP